MIFQTPTPNIAQSIDFYRKLNFQIIEKGQSTYVSDKSGLIKINPERAARAGVIFINESWKDTIEKVKDYTTQYETDNGYIITDSTGMWIYLVEGPSFEIEYEKAHSSILGNYMGLSLETLSMEGSAELWKHLGFQITMGAVDQGFMVMMDEKGNGVSFMKPNSCPHLFFNPSWTYFNSGKNPEIIAKIRAADIPITEEITVFNEKGEVDNVILRDPGGFGFFVFND